jgi:CHAD domain-containing protein
MTFGPANLADVVVDAALQLNNRALRTLADRHGLLSEKDIHQLRVTVKRLRALWKLVRKQVTNEQRTAAQERLRAVHRLLAPARDITVVAETLEKLRTKATDDVSRAACSRCASGLDNHLMPTVLAIPISRVSESFQEESRMWRELVFGDDSLDALLHGYTRCYRKGRKLAREVLGGASGEVLHELRRWAKFTLHQLDIIKPGLGDANRARRWYLDRLGDTLGAHNDCLILVERLPEFGLKRREHDCVMEQLEARMKFTRARVLKLLPHVYDDKPRVFRAQLREDVERMGLVEEPERITA